ncbi:glycerol-3-phosphate dehydrogenase/oxidase [Dyadobacter sandarakinus]|uniref:FAD-dependent oxidoreductase n=1 Tax=Dyadobacter sandarakinus TaxID=2747268 RepID=A0ABX7I4B9_9BACT|nr:FAD-dependent oxidoreductase [Dyadobacter sandarakinus]QRR00946.1 FAD-dependent oxidoreductase [Dyadobacter sandarakinus]
MNRTTSVERLKTEEFDICIIGAGASGAGCALDAALRGYKVALIDRQDFASETSSKSTKLIHGGVRYLEQAFKKFDFAQLRQVRHGLEERHTVLRNAPHLARPLPLVTPVSSWFEGLYFSIGLRIYDRFAVDDTLPKSQWLTKEQVLARIPTLNRKKLHSGVLYYDGQLDDARYCLALVQSAAEAGTAVANYMEVRGFGFDQTGRINSVRMVDLLTAASLEVRAKLVINCTGPFSDMVRLMANPALPERIRPSKGVHAVLPWKLLQSDHAMLIPKTADGRVVFAIPFEGALMIGTTDTETDGNSMEPSLNVTEKKYLLDTLNPYLEHKISIGEVKSGFGGLRPLLAADPSKSTKTLLRDHEIEVDEKSGLLSLLGGKWTTYRLMAKDTIDEAEVNFSKKNACTTDKHILAGAENFDADTWKQIRDTHNLEEDIARHLAQKYGSRAQDVAALIKQDPNLKSRVSALYPFILAEAAYCARHEMAVTLRDFLARRIRLEIVDWEETLLSLPKVAAVMGAELGWDEAEMKRQTEVYSAVLRKFMSDADGDTL